MLLLRSRPLFERLIWFPSATRLVIVPVAGAVQLVSFPHPGCVLTIVLQFSGSCLVFECRVVIAIFSFASLFVASSRSMIATYEAAVRCSNPLESEMVPNCFVFFPTPLSIG